MKTKQYWIKELDSWALLLKELLKSSYMEKLINFIEMEYSMNDIIPSKKDLFKRFRECNWQNISIVIIVPSIKDLYIKEDLGNHTKTPLHLIQEQIERQYYEGLNLNFDYSLEYLSKQGILILPLSLTSRKDNTDHKVQWNKFIQYIVLQLNQYRQGIIFLEWGVDLNLHKHHVIKYKSPYSAYLENIDWKFNFKQVDELTIKLNNYKIEW